MKAQALVDKTSRRILCTAFSEGKKHDFKLLCESKTYLAKTTIVKTDTGYAGIRKLHLNSELPGKKSKYHIRCQGKRSAKTELSRAHEY
jgi:hypothetical protein